MLFFFSFAECDIPEISETGIITLVGGGKGKELDVGQSVTLRCIFVGAFMDQPPSWWYQEETGGDYQRITSFKPGFGINATFDDSGCAWRSDLTIGQFELDSAGVYSCYRGDSGQSLMIDAQGMLILIEQLLYCNCAAVTAFYWKLKQQ